MDYKNLIPAPLDEKNIVTDWIEDVFDYQTAVSNNGIYLGFVDDIPMRCDIMGNKAHWMIAFGGYVSLSEDARRSALNELKRRLQVIDQDNEDNGIVVDYNDIVLVGIIQSFYFINH